MFALGICVTMAAVSSCSTPATEGSRSEADASAQIDDASVLDQSAPLLVDAGGPLLQVTGDTARLELRHRASGKAWPSADPLRSGLNYFGHGSHAQGAFVGTHHITRSSDLNWALQVADCVRPDQCVKNFRDTMMGAGFLFSTVAATSENVVVYFDRLPSWLSSCAAKKGAAHCNAASACGYRADTTNGQLYPPGDWTVWQSVVREAVDAMLDLLASHQNVANVYLEVRNEPNVANCSWNDTHESFLDYYRRTSLAFSAERDALCAAKNLAAQDCGRLKFGGPAVGVWNGKIDPARTTSLTEDLIAFAVAEARKDPAVKLDFVSFHAFFSSVPAPAAELRAARKAFEAAYANALQARPAPFPMPELLISEWNGGDDERAGPRHPALMAEGFWGLLQTDIRGAMIASLDYQDPAATLTSNDFGLLLPDNVVANWTRPAYFTYAAMRWLAEKSPLFVTAEDAFVKVLVSTPRAGEGGAQCFDFVMWDFAADPLALGLESLVDPARCGAALGPSYATAVPSGALPARCSALAARGAAAGGVALCQDIYSGSCDHIPAPTPTNGHACDTTWAGYFATAAALLAEGTRRETTPLGIELPGAIAVATTSIRAIVGDHQDPTPPVVASSTTGSGLALSVPRNGVLVATDVCVR